MQSVSTNSEQTKLLQDSLKAIPGAAGRAGARAVNYVASGLRKEAPRWVATEYAIPQARILELLTVEKANARMTIAEAAVVGVGKKGQPLLDFAVGNKSAPSTKRTGGSSPRVGGGYTPDIGIPVLIKRATGKKAAPGAFIAKMESGHIGVFKRRGGRKKQPYNYAGKERKPWSKEDRHGGIMKDSISEQFLPSPVNILAQPGYQTKVDSYVDEAMPDALIREIDRELR
jgi:hypothetical protein